MKLPQGVFQKAGIENPDKCLTGEEIINMSREELKKKKQ